MFPCKASKRHSCKRPFARNLPLIPISLREVEVLCLKASGLSSLSDCFLCRSNFSVISGKLNFKKNQVSYSVGFISSVSAVSLFSCMSDQCPWAIWFHSTVKTDFEITWEKGTGNVSFPLPMYEMWKWKCQSILTLTLDSNWLAWLIQLVSEQRDCTRKGNYEQLI